MVSRPHPLLGVSSVVQDVLQLPDLVKSIYEYLDVDSLVECRALSRQFACHFYQFPQRMHLGSWQKLAFKISICGNNNWVSDCLWRNDFVPSANHLTIDSLTGPVFNHIMNRIVWELIHSNEIEHCIRSVAFNFGKNRPLWRNSYSTYHLCHKMKNPLASLCFNFAGMHTIMS